MANYQIMYWKHIPSQLKAWDDSSEVKLALPDRFMAAIDAFAMREGSTDMDSYLDGWRWGSVEQRPGSAEEVARSVLKELVREHPRSRLMEPGAS